MSRVLCAGHINWDVTIHVDALPDPDGEARIDAHYQSGGGSAANVATALTGLGIETAVLGSVGDDDHGAAALRTLRNHGVDTEFVWVLSGRPTTVKYLIVETTSDGQVMVFGNDGANEAVTATDITDDIVRDIDHVHLTGQRPETARALVDHATATEATVSVDPGRRLADRDFASVLTAADLVFLNDREAECLPPGMDIESAGTADGGVLVRTDGKDGATVHTADETYRHEGFAVETIDTTGAGDAFAAGFLAVALGENGLDDGFDRERALTVANACGALTTTVTGPRLEFGWEDLDELLER